jgi:hypothetical protein
MPDIYFLLFDEYASSASLKDRFDFDNPLDSFLRAEGFRVQSASRGNYDFTPFSVASILNMSYIEGLKDPDAVNVDDYSRSETLIRNAALIDILRKQGYDIINYSIFDLKGHPSRTDEDMLPVKTKLITGRTLFAVLEKDIGWMRARYFPWVGPELMQRNLRNNNLFTALLEAFPSRAVKSPAFVYAHLEMPHVPYYFDKDGNKRPERMLRDEMVTESPQSYLGYLSYTNTVIRNCVRSIKQKDPAAMIVLMGDHGYRNQNSVKTKDDFLKNMNAVYYPGNANLALYDSISGVNQFRVVLNGLFGQQLPMLKDTGFILHEKN